MYPGGRQRAAGRSGSGARRSRGSHQRPLQTAEHGSRQTPARGQSHKATEVEKARIRPGGSLQAKLRDVYVFCRDWALQRVVKTAVLLSARADSLKEITPTVGQKLI